MFRYGKKGKREKAGNEALTFYVLKNIERIRSINISNL